MLTLTSPPRPARTDAQLRALAASGSSNFARKAQAELTQRMTERLRAEVAKPNT